MRRSVSGFTIVELIIVIVVIAVLASISVSAYTGIQKRANDSQRLSDINQLVKVLESYYADRGRYPVGSGSSLINSGWSTTGDGSWENLVNALKPYGTITTGDPVNTPGISLLDSAHQAYGYAYFANSAGTYCGSGVNQAYIIIYRLESSPQRNKLDSCTTTPLGPYQHLSNYLTVK